MGTVIVLLFIHFISDFVFQSDEVAINKSKSLWYLFKHAGLYTIPFCFYGNLGFALSTLVLHYIIDYYSSRIASAFWEHGDRHWFFVTIGADQFLHALSLILTYSLFIGGIY